MYKAVFIFLIGLMLYLLLKPEKKNRVKLIFTINNHQIKFLNMKLQLNKFIDTILKLKNSATGDLIPATFANVQLQSSDEAVFTANSDVNADGEIDVVPVAVGEGTLTATADATYVDPGTGEEVTRSKTASITVTVTQPEAGTEMVVTFGDPQDMPA